MEKSKKPKLEFNPETHEYLVDGVKFSSVTEILSSVGITPPIPYASDLDAWFGRAVHKAVELYVKKELGWEDIDPRLEPAVRAYQEFEKATGFVVEGTEKQLFSTMGNVAGTVDLYGTFRDRTKGVVDLKSGAVGNWVGIQTAGYAFLLNPFAQFSVRSTFRRFGLSLANGVPKLKEFTDDSDYHVWFSAVSVFNWKKNGGL